MDREQMTIRLPAELADRLRREADRRGYSVMDLVKFLLWDFVRQATPPE